jgi:hypothetical protein
MNDVKRFTALIAALGIWMGGSANSWSTLTLYYDHEFSGATEPADNGESPWLKAVFNEVDTHSITLKLTALLTHSEYASQWYFNVADDYIDYLHFDVVPGGTAPVPSVAVTKDSYKADGDGLFDILIDFGESAASRFTGGESITFTITSSKELSPAAFAYLSAPDGGNNGKLGLLAAAHVQGIGSSGNESGWIDGTIVPNEVVVPEPSTYLAGLLLGIPFAASTMRILRRRRQG